MYLLLQNWSKNRKAMDKFVALDNIDDLKDTVDAIKAITVDDEAEALNLISCLEFLNEVTKINERRRTLASEIFYYSAAIKLHLERSIESGSEIVKLFVEGFMKDFNVRRAQYENDEFLLKAAYLDPRFHHK